MVSRHLSIIPRGQTLGVTFAAPDADRYSYTDREPRARIDVGLGGLTAEAIVFGHITTGAESDNRQLTQVARHLVGRCGMNALIGPIAVLPPDALRHPDAVSADTQRPVDEEVRKLVATAHADVIALLTEHRDKLDRLARALLEHETLDHDGAYATAGVEARRN